MLRKVGASSKVVSTPRELYSARKIILPGVGAFDSGMKALNEHGFSDVLIEHATAGSAHILGVCLGMQMLGLGSEEGKMEGLGLIRGSCRKFPVSSNSRLKVPNMGWNEVSPSSNAALFDQDDELSRFYFVHSYYFECTCSENVAATTEYGITYAAAIQSDNVFGVQFHPEKSHRFGLRLLSRFWRL